ncbi:unnamed protein product [Linum tenue]|uniref:Uncharacterized protein n=1 Tax=Linum tenue TaxID=586396 RepID=A0AAV0Q0E4_9ROSI|nr:unnamed protein product [Linum tenue]
MASRKKEAEGIALLSVYSDEDDEEMEEPDEQGDGEAEMRRRQQQQQQQQLEGSDDRESNYMEEDSANDAMVTDEYGNGATPPEVALQQVQVSFSSSSRQQLQEGRAVSSKRSGRGRLTIVDYGHDEVAMSPEPEDAGREEMIPGPSQPFGSEASQLTDHSEAPQSDNMNNSSDELEAVKVEDSTGLTEGKADRLDKFLPPPPKEKCPSELQKIGRSFNAEVRNRKDYRNPDFLLDAVRYQEVDLRRDKERREQELKKSPKVEFAPGGTQPGIVVPPSRFSMAIPVAASGLPPAPEPVSRNGRQNKKSKWDKVDGDGRNSLSGGGQDSLATAAAAHAVSSANAGSGPSGYPAFVQQKRREAEERRSGERKNDRRS